MKYRVFYKVEAIEIWTGTVEADSEEQALIEIGEGNISNEEILDSETRSVFDEVVEGIEE
jgi:hypothetical protein